MLDRSKDAKGGREDHPIARGWRFLMEQLVQDVPEELAVCEFECRKLECTQGEWEVCDRRLRRPAGSARPVGQRMAS